MLLHISQLKKTILRASILGNCQSQKIEVINKTWVIKSQSHKIVVTIGNKCSDLISQFEVLSFFCFRLSVFRTVS